MPARDMPAITDKYGERSSRRGGRVRLSRSGPGQLPETLRQASDRFERIIVQRVLEEVGAARVLGLHRNSLRRRLRDAQGPEIELAGLVRQERRLAAAVLGYPKLPSGLMFTTAVLVTLAVIYVLAKCCS